MSKIEEMLAQTKLNEFLQKREDDKQKTVILWILAVIGAVAAVAAIAFGVYKFLSRDYLDDFEEEFDDDFDDYFNEEDQV